MGGTRYLLACVFAAGCLPRPEPAQPQTQSYPQQQPYAQQQAYPQQQGYPQQPAYPQQQAYPQQPTAPQQAPQPATAPAAAPATAQGGVTVTQPTSPQPAPSTTAATPATAPGGVTVTQPTSPQQPAYGYAQPAYYPQAYPPPPAYPPPMPIGESQPSSSRLHDGEVIADFAVVGTFASIDLLARQDFDNGNAVGFLLVAGMAGGGGIGYLLTNKYDVDAGAAHATTLGLTLGFANGALLIEPTGWEESESVLNLLFLGSAAGATGGFIYGQAAKLTSGQSMFVANMALLGSATAALGAITGSQDGEFGSWENGSLAIGLDGGTAAGALIAPSLDWSPKRAKVVLASTVIGALVGGMAVGLLTENSNDDSRTENGDIAAAGMTAGLWGGFGLGVLMTKQYTPDARFAQPQRASASASRDTSSPAAVMPWVGVRGALGVMTGGSF